MAVVRDFVPSLVPVGGSVCLFGAGFDGNCRVLINDKATTVLDYDRTTLEFACPDRPGNYSVKLVQDGAEKYRSEIFVVSFENALTWNLPRRFTEDFRYALLSLMPRGFAWYTQKDGNWWKLFSAFASGFKAVHDDLRLLVDELSPFKTTDYGSWEHELGLPIDGFEQNSNNGRKKEIVRVARKKGGCTVPYLKTLLNLYGARYEIYEFFKNPSVFPSWVAQKNGELSNFFVLIKVYRDSYDGRGVNCKSKCNASLGNPRDLKLESIVDRFKPAHIKIIYRYFVKILTDMNGNPIVNDSNQMIIV